MKKLLNFIFSIEKIEKHKVITILGVKIKKRLKPKTKTTGRFGLHSGERQVAETLDGIRKDHLDRYKMANDFLKQEFSDSTISGADIFCGNGYGSYLISKENPKTTLIAIDGSEEAIILAKDSYQTPNIDFQHKLFPFEFVHNNLNFVISFESIEHIEDDLRFFDDLYNSLKQNGLLFLSVPNEAIISLTKNKHPFHIRHYTKEQVLKISEKYNLSLLKFYGQDVYVLEDGKVVSAIEPEQMGLQESYEGQFLVFVFRK